MPLTAKPDAAAYGVFPQALAQTLGASGNAVDKIALFRGAKQSQQNYTDAIAAAQQVEAAMNHDDNQRQVATGYFSAVPQMTDKGISRGVHVAENPYFSTDGEVLAQGDLINANRTDAAAMKDRLDALANYADKTGNQDTAAANAAIQGPVGDDPGQLIPHLTPKQIADQQTADAATTRADADMYAAKHGKPTSSGMGANGQSTTQYIVGPNGEPIPISIQVKRPGVQAGPGGGGVQVNRPPPKLGPDGKTIIPR